MTDLLATFSAASTFDARVLAGRDIVTAAVRIQGSLASVVLWTGVFVAAENPSWSTKTVAAETIGRLSTDIESGAAVLSSYGALLKNALGASKNARPTWDGAVNEPDKLAMVDKFCAGASLRALSDGVTTLRSESSKLAAETRKASDAAENVAAEQAAVGALGGHESVAAVNAAALAMAFGKLQAAATATADDGARFAARAMMQGLADQAAACVAAWKAADLAAIVAADLAAELAKADAVAIAKATKAADRADAKAAAKAAVASEAAAREARAVKAKYDADQIIAKKAALAAGLAKLGRVKAAKEAALGAFPMTMIG